MAEIYSKSLVRAIGKVLLMKFSYRTPNKINEGDEKWSLFVNKQLFWWSMSIALNNNNAVMFNRHLAIFLALYFSTYLSWPDWLYFYCFFNFEYFDSLHYYAACSVPLNVTETLHKYNKVYSRRSRRRCCPHSGRRLLTQQTYGPDWRSVD